MQNDSSLVAHTNGCDDVPCDTADTAAAGFAAGAGFSEAGICFSGGGSGAT